MARRSGGNDKYLRLTGLWQSKKNSSLFTGKLKTEQLEELEKKVAEALESDAPLLFGLWENDKKESKRDPEFSLQCFVGDSEEKPTSRRDRDNDRGSSRRSSRDNDTDNDNQDNQDDPQDDPQDDNQDDPEPEQRSSRKKGTSTRKSNSSRDEGKRTSTKKRADW